MSDELRKPPDRTGLPGRPTELTSEVYRRIRKALLAGSYRTDAAKYGGVAYSSFNYWLKRGKNEPGTIYSDFRRMVIRSEELVRVQMAGTIVAARKNDWKAAAWWLERKSPDKWAKRARLDGTVVPLGPDGKPLPAGAAAAANGFKIDFEIVGVAPETEAQDPEDVADGVEEDDPE